MALKSQPKTCVRHMDAIPAACRRAGLPLGSGQIRADNAGDGPRRLAHAQARAGPRQVAARRGAAPRAIRACSMAFRPLFAAKPRENRAMCAACPKNNWAAARDACNGKKKSPAQGRGARRKLDPAAPASLAPGLNSLDIADSPKPKQLLNALPVVRNDAAPGTFSVAYAVHSICGLGAAYKPSQMHKRRVCGCSGAAPTDIRGIAPPKSFCNGNLAKCYGKGSVGCHGDNAPAIA